MRIDMRVEESELVRANRYSGCHRESRPPWTFMPRQIDSRHITQRKTTQERDARVAFIMQVNRLFKVEPPLPLDWRNATRNSRRRVDPFHPELFSEFLGDM